MINEALIGKLQLLFFSLKKVEVDESMVVTGVCRKHNTTQVRCVLGEFVSFCTKPKKETDPHTENHAKSYE